VTFDPNKTSHYNSKTKTINVNPDNTPLTLYHEGGHALDHACGTRRPIYIERCPITGQGMTTTRNTLKQIGGEIAANVYGKDSMKHLGASNKEIEQFNKNRKGSIKTYQADLLWPDKVEDQYIGMGTWLYDNDKEKRKKKRKLVPFFQNF